MTRKLGSVLGEAEDVARRKQLANVAFRKLSTMWFRLSRIRLSLGLRLYESIVWVRTTVAIYARSSTFIGRTASWNTALYPPLSMSPHQRGREIGEMASVRPRATHATGRTRSTSDRLLFRRHRSRHVQRATTNDSAQRVEC